MKAFHNDSLVKHEYLNRVRGHFLADQIMKGRYWENGRGCAVGCTVHSSDHSAYERELGIPQIIARLEDLIFEGLPLARAKEWPEQFLRAIKVGANLSAVWPQFAQWLMVDPEHGVLRFARNSEQRECTRRVAYLYKNGGTREEFEAAARAAARAAAYAARAAADAADAADAANAARAAAYAAAYAAAHAAAAAADAAARDNEYVAQANKLLELLKAA